MTTNVRTAFAIFVVAAAGLAASTTATLAKTHTPIVTKAPINVLKQAPVTAGPSAAPSLYTFTLVSFKITDTRSVHEDTDFASIAVSVGGAAASGPPVKSMGDLNNGTYPVGLSVKNVSVDPKQSVDLSYSIVNTGYAANSVEQDLIKATDAAAEAGAKAGAEAASTAVTGTPLPGTAIAAASKSWIDDLVGVIFADCDGPVAGADHVYSGAQLSNLTAGGKVLTMTDKDPGTDSPHGCGGNSMYYVTWSISAQH